MASIGAVALAAVPASAAKVKTDVVATPAGPITVTYGAASPTVTVSLDGNCLNAFGHGQSFGFAAGSDNPSVATVSPASTSGLQCGDSSIFTVTGVANGSATLRFDAVATQGLQTQTAGKSVTANVGGFPTTGDPNPPGHDRPAAPAVANGFLNTQSQTDACKAAYGGAHNWHGKFIAAVAHWSAAGHLSSKKDDPAFYATDNDWIAAVQAEVNTLCA